MANRKLVAAKSSDGTSAASRIPASGDQWKVLVHAILVSVGIIAVCLCLAYAQARWWGDKPVSTDYLASLSAAGSLIGGLATALAVAAAWHAYQTESRRHAAGVLLDAYSRFYDDENKRVIRSALDQYGDPVLKKVALDVVSGRRELSVQESDLCDKLDDYLNYFQFIAWLRDHRDLDLQSVNAMFRYYLSNLSDDRNVWLLDYMRRFGYWRLEKFLREWKSQDQSNCDRLFAYGTLRGDCRSAAASTLLGNRRSVGKAVVPGRLYHIIDGAEEYPALVDSWHSGEIVHGSIYEVTTEELKNLDVLEECRGEAGDLYRRRCSQVKLSDGSWINAWVYVWNRETAGLTRIESGDWAEYTKNRR